MDPVSGQRGNLIFTVVWAVNAASTVQDDAQVLAGLLTSEKAQQWVLEKGLAIPSRVSLADNAFLSGDSNAAVASRMVFDGQSDGNVQPYYIGAYGGAWLEPINSAINSVLLGESDVDPAFAEAQAKLDQLSGN